MPSKSKSSVWPKLPYAKFAPTAYLVHRGVQAMGKLKLLTPFEPEWANVCLTVTSRGLTTGLIPYENLAFTIDFDCINHEIIATTTSGKRNKFSLKSMSVANLINKIMETLKKVDVSVNVNPQPQEVPNPILFDEDTEVRPYDAELVNAWWRILVSSTLIMQRYHAKFFGKTQPIGFMWGTFDLRDVRFKDSKIVTPKSGPNSGYLRRNAMDSAQIESGWWSGNEAYPHPAYYSFTFPEPADIAHAKMLPKEARWDDKLKLFILDYEVVRQSQNPNQTLLDFLESTYQAGAKLAKWDPKLIGSGVPV